MIFGLFLKSSLVLHLCTQRRQFEAAKYKTRNTRKSALNMHFLSVTCFDFELTEDNKRQSCYPQPSVNRKTTHMRECYRHSSRIQEL